MKQVAKFALSAMLLAGTAFAVTTPAAARVSIGIGVGVGPGYGYYGPPRAAAICNPYSRYYDPYECDDYYSDYYDYYDGPPIFFDGAWYSGRLQSRYYGGHRQFWVGGGWHTSERYNGGGHFYAGGHGGYSGHSGYGGHGDYSSGGHGGSYRGGGGYSGGSHDGGGHSGGHHH